jgi:nucleoside-diphosphate kinase
MIKPDGVQRGLIGRLLGSFEDRGMKLVALKLVKVSSKRAEEHYAEHEGKDFHKRLLSFINSGPVIVAVIEAPDAVRQVRKMIGVTDPAEAEVGTIRQKWAQDTRYNLIHASDSPESAEREIGLFFDEDEILDYHLDIHRWVLFPE